MALAWRDAEKRAILFKNEGGIGMRRVLIGLAAACLIAVPWRARPLYGLTDADAQGQGKVLIFSVREGRLILMDEVRKSDEEWRKLLTPEQYAVTRKKGTERAFAGAYHNHHEPGVYKCVCCGIDLYPANTKFDSGTGWPSFWASVDPRNIRTAVDAGLFMRRTEVLCARCGAHLGHVFDDGPPPTGQRHCINSVALTFEKAPPPQGR